MAIFSFDFSNSEEVSLVSCEETLSDKLKNLITLQTNSYMEYTSILERLASSNRPLKKCEATLLLAKWNEICNLRREINNEFKDLRESSLKETCKNFYEAVVQFQQILENMSNEELLTSRNGLFRVIGIKANKRD